MSSECHVSGLLATILRGTRFWGLSPLQFVKDGESWRIRVSKGYTLYGYLVMILCVFFMALRISCHNTIHDKSVSIQLREVMMLLDATLTMVTVCIMVVRAPFCWKRLIKVFCKLEQINSNLNYIPTKESKTTIFIVLAYLVAAFVLGVTRFITIRSMIISEASENDTVKFPYYLTMKTIAFFMYFVFFWAAEINMQILRLIVMRVQVSFLAINETLKKLLQEITNNSEQFCHHGDLRKITLAYDVASTSVKEVNSCLGLPLVMSLVYIFYHLNLRHYFFIMSLQTHFSNEKSGNLLRHVIPTVPWCLFYLLNVILLISPCHDTHVQIRAIRPLVSKLFLYTRSIHDPLAVELELLYKMLFLHRAAYRPMNFCTWSRGLVLALWGNITTYLTILIQLR